MIRRIITTQHQAAGPGHEVDTFLDRVVKYIPTEIVTAWVAAKGIIAAAGIASKETVLWICFAAGLILTFLYTLKQTAVPGKPPATMQAAIATGAFIVWTFALGEPFASWLGTVEQSLYGALLLILYTLVVPLIPVQQS